MKKDVHAPYVGELAEVENWAGLMRYWMAHREHGPAIDAAIQCARDRSQYDKHWAPLSTYLEKVKAREQWSSLLNHLENGETNTIDSCHPPYSIPPELASDFTEVERGTIHLLQLYPLFVLCESADSISVSKRNAFTPLFMEAARTAIELAHRFSDPALAANFLRLKALAHWDTRQFEPAMLANIEAVAIYRTLAVGRPEIYQARAAGILNNLGAVQRSAGDVKGARVSYTEALKIFRQLAEESPEVYRINVAGTLNNLGNAESSLNELAAARASYLDALTIYRELSLERAGVAPVLNNLIPIQRALNDVEGAEKSLAELMAILHHPAAKQPKA